MTTEHVVKPLSMETWDSYAALVEKHNGVWGGCWCTYFHADTEDNPKKQLGGHDFKKRMVELGIAHAALVFDDENAIGWCEYGSPAELPGIYHRKQVEGGEEEPPRYRITCFFIDRDYRRSGVAIEALTGALGLIAAAGGGVVESYPRDSAGEKISASFLHNVTRGMFERAGFEYIRPVGKSKCIMRKTVLAA